SPTCRSCSRRSDDRGDVDRAQGPAAALAAPRVPGPGGAGVAAAAPAGRVRVAPPVRGDRPAGLLLAARGADAGLLRAGVEPGRAAPLLPEHAHHRDPGAGADAV